MSSAPLSVEPDPAVAEASTIAHPAAVATEAPNLAVDDLDRAADSAGVPARAADATGVQARAGVDTEVPDRAVEAAAESGPIGHVPSAKVPTSNGVVDAFYLLQNAEALYQSRLRDRLHLGANELGAMQVISRLATLGSDARALDISRSLGVTNGATSVILAHLVARGYLTRTANPRDGRGKLLHLSDEATAIVSHSLDDSQSDLSLLVSGMSSRESKRVVVLLTAVTSSLDNSGYAGQ